MYLGTVKGAPEMVQADEPSVFLLNILSKVKGAAALCCRPTEHGLDLKNGSQGSAAVSSVCLSVGVSSARSQNVTEMEYALDSKTETLLICITSHMLCCKNFHCACFRIELTLHKSILASLKSRRLRKKNLCSFEMTLGHGPWVKWTTEDFCSLWCFETFSTEYIY